jgi:hypothetical protein
VKWYFALVYGQVEGPGVLPFYCDPTKVGRFAVRPEELSSGAEAPLFRLLVATAMYQARRDVLIMAQQRSMSVRSARALTVLRTVKQSIEQNRCSKLASADAFDQGCDVKKMGNTVDCGCCSGISCHVKDATVAFNRMGDMGKLPTSAWLHLWRYGGLGDVLCKVLQKEKHPARRAVLMVDRIARVHRVGKKLATMFVSALSTPALAPGLTPWFPDVDGNELVVVDTNVARAVDALRAPNAPRTYEARARWVREQAVKIDLRQFHSGVPSYSPRLVQQAFYAFGSKSNRVARADECSGRDVPCVNCVPALCPFGTAGC